MSDQELIVNTAKEFFLRLLETHPGALKIDTRPDGFLASIETAFTAVLQSVSKCVRTISN
jgi:hypothetical protein